MMRVYPLPLCCLCWLWEHEAEWVNVYETLSPYLEYYFLLSLLGLP